jgi:hypothetical protein
MNFSHDQVDLILAGKKTEDWRDRCVVRPRRSYALQAAGVTRGRITVMSVTPDVILGSMTLRQAKRAGFKSTRDAVEHWRTTHGGLYDPDLRVFIISFVLGDQTDTPRLLAARPGAPHGDYVDSSARALKGEPEAIPAALQARYSGEARAARQAIDGASLGAKADRVLDMIREISAEATTDEARKSFRVAERGVLAAQRKIGAV